MTVRSIVVSSHQHCTARGRGWSSVLRTAVGLAAGYQGHRLSVVLAGRGVYAALKELNNGFDSRYLRAASVHEISLFVEKESLEGLGLEEAELTEGVELLTAEEYLQKVCQADHHLRLS